MIKLGDWILGFDGAVDAGLTGCSYGGIEILRTVKSDPSLRDARDLSAFVMLPFIGRITKGVFSFKDEEVHLAANMPPEPHAIHGRGWQSVWQRQDTGTDRVAFQHHHAGESGWPWAYRARQAFRAQGESLTWSASLTNEGARDMPAGLGWHPYFPRQDAQLQADISHIWRAQSDHHVAGLPVTPSAQRDIRQPRPVRDLKLDHCFSLTGERKIRLRWPKRHLSVTLQASDIFRFLTVYTPPDEDYFCVEPVSHTPDAVNNTLPYAQTGLKVLRPGETLQGSIMLTVDL